MRWWHLTEVMPVERALFGAEAWSEGLFWSELAQLASRFYRVARDVDGALVGYAGLAAHADEAYVQTIGVRPDRQGEGVGTALLSELVDEAGRRGARRLALEVRADNPRAQRLYARFGFEPVGLRRGYYQPSNTDAVVMVRHS